MLELEFLFSLPREGLNEDYSDDELIKMIIEELESFYQPEIDAGMTISLGRVTQSA